MVVGVCLTFEITNKKKYNFNALTVDSHLLYIILPLVNLLVFFLYVNVLNLANNFWHKFTRPNVHVCHICCIGQVLSSNKYWSSCNIDLDPMTLHKSGVHVVTQRCLAFFFTRPCWDVIPNAAKASALLQRQKSSSKVSGRCKYNRCLSYVTCLDYGYWSEHQIRNWIQNCTTTGNLDVYSLCQLIVEKNI